MPAFAFNILDAGGQHASGRLDAEDMGTAAAVLRSQGARILDLQPAGSSSVEAQTLYARLEKWVYSHLPVTTADKVHAFSHLSMMARAGLSLSHALHLITPETPKPKMQVVLEDVTRQVESGYLFSVALSAHPAIFPTIVTSIIGSAEESGEMADGLDRVCKHLQFWADLRKTLLQSLMYPAIVVVLAIGVTALLVTVFIPKVEKFVTGKGNSLPPLTQFLFDLAHFLQNSWLWMSGGAVVLGTAWYFAFQRPAFRAWSERVLLGIPVLGGTWQAALLARSCGLLAVLLQSGTSLVRALEVSAETLGSLHFRAIFLRTLDSVVRGFSLRNAMDQRGIPGTMLGVISAGEEAGDLPRCFRELENYYATRLSSRLLMLVTLIEPALIIFVGGIVALVYMALFSAVLSLVR